MHIRTPPSSLYVKRGIVHSDLAILSSLLKIQKSSPSKQSCSIERNDPTRQQLELERPPVYRRGCASYWDSTFHRPRVTLCLCPSGGSEDGQKKTRLHCLDFVRKGRREHNTALPGAVTMTTNDDETDTSHSECLVASS
jgi:hypothetical protein